LRGIVQQAIRTVVDADALMIVNVIQRF